MGIIGRNGSGKSTILKLIAGVTAPSDGEIAVYGRVSEGDLLSDSGYIVARNWDLIAGFHPANNDDVGLDAADLDTEQPCRNVVPSLQAVDPAGVLADQ